MSILTSPPAPCQPSSTHPRSLCLLQPFDAEGRNAVLRIRQQKGRKETVDLYWVDRLPHDFGQHAFQFEKQGSPEGAEENTTYAVLIEGPAVASCECPGNLRWGHQTECRHIAAVRQLIALGKV